MAAVAIKPIERNKMAAVGGGTRWRPWGGGDKMAAVWGGNKMAAVEGGTKWPPKT